MERDSRRRGADIPVYTEIAEPPECESANERSPVEVCQIPTSRLDNLGPQLWDTWRAASRHVAASG